MRSSCLLRPRPLSVPCLLHPRLRYLVAKLAITTRSSCSSLVVQKAATKKHQEAVPSSPVPQVSVDAEALSPARVPPHYAAPGSASGSNQPAHATETGSPAKHPDDEAGQNTPSLRSLPTEPEGQESMSGMRTTFKRASSALARKGSVRTTRSTHTTGATSAFANGAPLMGPDVDPDVDESLFERGDKAERSLSQRQKDRIAKEERKESMKFSKLLKTESSNEKVALDSALKNLSALQSLHKAAIKRETRAEASHARALAATQNAESKFQEEKARAAEVRARAEARCIEERARWGAKEGELHAQHERLESARETVRETEARIVECARQVERLRIVKATDEREREAKLTELVGEK